jgi:allophanate hydrolase subunit 2
MSVLLIEEVGPATSVQDFGRYGALRYGLGTTGAMDRVGLACANALVGLGVLAVGAVVMLFAHKRR